MSLGGTPFGQRVDRVYDLDDDDDLRIVGQTKNERRADKIVHFVECNHVVVEEKGRAQKLERAIGQITATIGKARVPNIRFAVVVKDKIPRAEQGFYHWDRNTWAVTFAHSPGRPVIVANGLPLLMMPERQARAYGLV